MFWIVFKGGLGNQMFQYVLYKNMLKCNKESFADLSLYKNKPESFQLDKAFDNITIKTNDDIDIKNFIKFSNSKNINRLKKVIGVDNVDLILNYIYKNKLIYVHERNKYINIADIINSNEKTYIKGYWQNPVYFGDNEIDSFVFSSKKDEAVNKVMKQISSDNSISLHIRGGDYLKNKKYDCICDAEYYKKAIKYFANHVNNARFYIFTNDNVYAESIMNNIHDVNNFSIVSDLIGGKYNDWNDMEMMSLCKHNIIANSSFSWWGAYLNKNPNKIVVSPKKWTNDGENDALILDEYIKI